MPISLQRGATLLEMIVFIVVIGVALVAIGSVYNQSISASVDPMVQVRGLELAQAKLDEVLARKYDGNTPTGGVPACGSAEPGAVACAGIVPDAALDDVGDFHGQIDNGVPGYPVSTQVSLAGADLGLANDQAKKIAVSVQLPTGEILMLSAYRVNF